MRSIFKDVEWVQHEADLGDLLKTNALLGEFAVKLIETLHVPVTGKRRTPGQTESDPKRLKATPAPTVVHVPVPVYGYPQGMAGAAMASLQQPQQQSAFAAHAPQLQQMQQFVGGFAHPVGTPAYQQPMFASPAFPSALAMPTGSDMGSGMAAPTQMTSVRAMCTHCNRPGHVLQTCWILHPELRPKRS